MSDMLNKLIGPAMAAARAIPGTAASLATAAAAAAAVSAAEAAASAASSDGAAAQAMVAAAYSSSATYAVGDYCVYNGALYVCNTAITTAEAWTSGHWTAAVVGEDLSDLKTAISDITQDSIETESVASKSAGTTTLPAGITSTTGYLRNMEGSSAGGLTGTSNSNNVTYYMLAEEAMDVYVISNSGSSRQIGVFSGEPYGSSNRVSAIYASNTAGYPYPTAETPLHVDANQYITFSFYNSSGLESNEWDLRKVANVSYGLKSTLPLTEQQADDIDAKLSFVYADGYDRLTSGWERGGWLSWDNKDSRLYRVRQTGAVKFDRPVKIAMKPGFHIEGYYSGSTLSGGCVAEIPANTSVKLYVRRITENESEIADVDTFAAAVQISTALSPIELYSPTFTDVSMFERVGVCGDSYAAGGGIISGVTALTWGKNLERQAGITVDIYAKSGEDVVGWNFDSTHGLPALLAGTECGLYWMAHGINGTSTAEALGTAADMSASPHPATFYGQYVEAIEQIKATFPDARIVLATITGSSYNLYQTNYADVNAAILAIAEYCEVPVVDIGKDAFYQSDWYADNIRSNHPTAMLCAGMAMANRRVLAKCIMDNPSYFVEYGSD